MGNTTVEERSTSVRSHRVQPAQRRRTAAVVAVCAFVLSACWSANQDKDLGYINQSRRQNGKAAVNGDAQLMGKAQVWAEHLADIGRLEHSGNGRIDTRGITNWCGVAENVGYASSTWATHQAFLASPGHRANVLGTYDRAGTGVVRRGDTVWVVELYVRSC